MLVANDFHITEITATKFQDAMVRRRRQNTLAQREKEEALFYAWRPLNGKLRRPQDASARDDTMKLCLECAAGEMSKEGKIVQVG